MKKEIEEIKEMLETDAKIFDNRGEKVAAIFARNVAKDLQEILEKERD